MKRKFTLLTVLGALLAMAVPASSGATMYPAEHKFEISGTAMPNVSSSLAGSCQLGKVTGQIPPLAGELATVTPTVGTCTAGVSLTLSGKWFLNANSISATLLMLGAEGAVLRYSSLPGCKLYAHSPSFVGVWSNGITTPKLVNAGFHGHSSRVYTWANDGGSCALAGKTETVKFASPDTSTGGGSFSPASATVTDTTNPANVITAG